jgi:hypothetical protein
VWHVRAGGRTPSVLSWRRRDCQMPQCPNCSAVLVHEYCGTCGQRRIHPQDLSARHFVRELVDEIANLSSKFKILRSVRGLLTPGFLTAEYLAGRGQSAGA